MFFIIICYSAIIQYSTYANELARMITAIDYMHFTPLHYAVKSGNEENTLLILKSLSEQEFVGEKSLWDFVNSKGHRHKTPLHKARSTKVVKLLVDYGADMYLKKMDKTDGQKCNVPQSHCKCGEVPCTNDTPCKNCKEGNDSVFSTILIRNDKSAEEIMNKHITTNKQSLDSSDLLIIYDLNIFKHEAKKVRKMDNRGRTKAENSNENNECRAKDVLYAVKQGEIESEQRHEHETAHSQN